jgi:hypothetical protein
MQQDVRIMVIKLIDRLHNMETIQYLKPERQLSLSQETYDVYVKIADRLCMLDLRYELEGMCLSILEPELYAKLVELRDQGKDLSRTIAEKMATFVEKNESLRDNVKVHFEFKSWNKLRAQYNAGGSAATGVANATMVFVCSDRDTCYRVLGALHEPWRREIQSFQDFINSPMINGYRGLHTTIILEDGTRVRCKIRTKEMQEYARKGVTTLCFKADRREALEKLLPWTQRIDSVAEDTRNRSQDFWQGLQIDILGESLTVHGQDDRTVQLPKGATALDAAFYLFEANTLSIQSIKINGKEVPLYSPITHAATLNATFSEEPTVRREWLRWVQTGYATARIRSALASESEQKRANIGRELLQEIMLEKKKGFIEEFDKKMLDERTQQIGFLSLEDAFVAAAEGRIDTLELYATLFEKTDPSQPDRNQSYLISFTYDSLDEQATDSINAVMHTQWNDIQVIRHFGNEKAQEKSMQLKVRMPSKRLEKFRFNLELAGAKNIEVIVRSKREIMLLTTVISLWALNPVAAKWLLGQGMDILSLLTIRFLIFAVFTTGFLIVWRQITKAKFTPIPHLTVRAVIPALWNAVISTFTYLALSFLPASIHLTLLRFNTLLLSLRSNPKKLSAASLALLLLFLTVCATFVISGFVALGIILSISTLLCYTFYSLSLERTLHQHRIDIRYPYLLFQMGLLLGFIGMVLAFFQPLDALLHDTSIYTILYVLFCVCIPHVCYSALIKTTRFKHFTDYFLLEVPLAMFLESMILGLVLPVSLYAVIAITIGTLLVFQWRKSIVTME